MKVTVLMNDSRYNNGQVVARDSEIRGTKLDQELEVPMVVKNSRRANVIRDEVGTELGQAPVTWENDLFINNGTFTVETDNALEACGEMYVLFNQGGPENYRGPSMSIGDVVVVDGQAFACTEMGFTAIDRIQDDNIIGMVYTNEYFEALVAAK